MKNGFTLIELLAVIVILAIIALIATPIVLSIIEDAEASAALRSAEYYLNAVEHSIMNKNINAGGSFSPNTCIIQSNVNLLCDGKDLLEVEANGEVPSSGTITFNEGKIIDAELTLGNKNIVKNEKGDLLLLGVNVPFPKSFAEDSWETIAANVRAGNLSKYKVGDTKEIALTGFTNTETDSNGLYTVRIANTTNTGDVCTKEYLEREDGTKEKYSKTACGFVIEFEDIILSSGDDAKMNSTNINAGGWKDSKMRTYVNETIYNALPKELKDVIIPTYVVSGYGKGDSPNKESTDKLYLLSTAEVWEQGTNNSINYDTARDVTRQLDYYKNYENADKSIGLKTDIYSGAIKKHNGTDIYWWLRSSRSSNDRQFYAVYIGGIWTSHDANTPRGVAVAFRIG